MIESEVRGNPESHGKASRKVAVPKSLPRAIPFLGLAAVYALTMLPGVGFSGDTAKFQFVGKILGTPHAPGYPLYLLLNRLFGMLLPVGSAAFTSNLLSLILTVVACFILSKTLEALKVRRSIADVSAVSFGLTATVWSQALVAEVYALNLLLLSLVVYCMILWSLTRNSRPLFLAVFFYAVSFGNHLTMIALLPALVVFMGMNNPRTLVERRFALWVAFCTMLGAALYLYLFIRSSKEGIPYVEIDVGSLGQFVWYVSGGEFRDQMFSFSVGQIFFDRIPMFLKFLVNEFLSLVPLVIIGAWPRRSAGFRTLVWIGIAGNAVFGLNYWIHDIAVYFIPTFFFLALFLGSGIEAVWKFLGRRSELRFSFLLWLFPIMLAVVNFIRVDQSANTKEAEDVTSVLQTVGRDAIIVPRRYREAEYFWYYLLAEDWQARNIHILFNFTLEPPAGEIKSYLLGERVLTVKPRRMSVPFGLPMYCVGDDHRGQFDRSGLILDRVHGDLYRIVLSDRRKDLPD